MNKTRFNNLEFFYDKELNVGGEAQRFIAGWFRGIINNSITFVEIGAHIGTISCSIGKMNPKKLILYEPNPDSFNILLQNLKLNDIRNFEANNKAVSDKNGEIVFYKRNDQPAGSNIFEGDEKIIVESIALDNLDFERPIAMKIDAEYSELLIWQGGREFLKKVDWLCIEFAPQGLVEKGFDPMQLIEWIKEDGFVIDDIPMDDLLIAKRDLLLTRNPR